MHSLGTCEHIFFRMCVFYVYVWIFWWVHRICVKAKIMCYWCVSRGKHCIFSFCDECEWRLKCYAPSPAPAFCVCPPPPPSLFPSTWIPSLQDAVPGSSRLLHLAGLLARLSFELILCHKYSTSHLKSYFECFSFHSFSLGFGVNASCVIFLWK